MTSKRITKHEYYLGIAKEVARRSTCFRRSIGAIIILFLSCNSPTEPG